MQHVAAVRVGNTTNREPFGPLPAVRIGDAVAYEWEWQVPAHFAGGGIWRLERVYVLLDVGVCLSFLDWVGPQAQDCWYVDLVEVEQHGDRYTFRDRYLDLIIPTDGRPYRTLDLDEYADAIANGTLSTHAAADGLRRWQRFIDEYVQTERYPTPSWTNFPPAAIRPLRDLPAPLGKPVRWYP